MKWFVMAIALVFTLGLSQAAVAADSATGTWKWTGMGGKGGQARETTLKLKQDGDKLTGTISGRQADTAIEDGKISGDEISFSVKREGKNGAITTKYTGKLSGDTIKGKVEFGTGDKAKSNDWEAKRSAE